MLVRGGGDGEREREKGAGRSDQSHTLVAGEGGADLIWAIYVVGM